MIVRRATEADREAIERLWQAFCAEAPPPPWVENAFESAREQIAGSIEDRRDNSTRFLVIGGDPPPPSGRDLTSILFTIRRDGDDLFVEVA